MAFTGIQLTDPESGYTSVLKPRDGVTCMSLEITPALRVVSESRSGAFGVVDSTRNADGAAVTLSLRLWPADSGLTPEALQDELGALLRPDLRPALVVSNDAWTGDRQLTVRFDGKSGPVDNPATVDVGLQWVAVNGVWEAAQATTFRIPAIIPGTGGLQVPSTGLAVPSTGLAVVAGTGGGEPVVRAGGNVPAQWTASLYGPATGPKLANDTAGYALEFSDDLVLRAGEYVALDSQAHTALMNGDPSSSVLGSLLFGSSDWWLIQPGANNMRYYPTSASPGAAAVGQFRSAWMT